MILDYENKFSNDQAVTTSAASSNIIDLGADDAAIQELVERGGEILAQVTTDFADGTSIAVSVQVDDDSAFGSATTLFTTSAIAVADLVAGYQFVLGAIPPHVSERYMRLYYTVVGVMTAGNIDAGILLDKQTNGM